MKAHRSIASLSAVARKDGEAYEIQANAFVDGYAKRGADLHLFDHNTMVRVERAEIAATAVAKFVSSILVWAVDKLPRQFGQLVRVPKFSRSTEVTEGEKRIAHDPVFDAGFKRWRCTRCFSSAETRQVLNKFPCVEFDTKFVKHSTWLAGPFVFCIRCGAYSELRSIILRKSCGGGPMTYTARRNRENLKHGRHPVSGAHVGEPRPFVLHHALAEGGIGDCDVNACREFAEHVQC